MQHAPPPPALSTSFTRLSSLLASLPSSPSPAEPTPISTLLHSLSHPSSPPSLHQLRHLARWIRAGVAADSLAEAGGEEGEGERLVDFVADGGAALRVLVQSMTSVSELERRGEGGQEEGKGKGKARTTEEAGEHLSKDDAAWLRGWCDELVGVVEGQLAERAKAEAASPSRDPTRATYAPAASTSSRTISSTSSTSHTFASASLPPDPRASTSASSHTPAYSPPPSNPTSTAGTTLSTKAALAALAGEAPASLGGLGAGGREEEGEGEEEGEATEEMRPPAPNQMLDRELERAEEDDEVGAKQEQADFLPLAGTPSVAQPARASADAVEQRPAAQEEHERDDGLLNSPPPPVPGSFPRGKAPSPSLDLDIDIKDDDNQLGGGWDDRSGRAAAGGGADEEEVDQLASSAGPSPEPASSPPPVSDKKPVKRVGRVVAPASKGEGAVAADGKAKGKGKGKGKGKRRVPPTVPKEGARKPASIEKPEGTGKGKARAEEYGEEQDQLDDEVLALAAGPAAAQKPASAAYEFSSSSDDEDDGEGEGEGGPLAKKEGKKSAGRANRRKAAAVVAVEGSETEPNKDADEDSADAAAGNRAVKRPDQVAKGGEKGKAKKHKVPAWSSDEGKDDDDEDDAVVIVEAREPEKKKKRPRKPPTVKKPSSISAASIARRASTSASNGKAKSVKRRASSPSPSAVASSNDDDAPPAKKPKHKHRQPLDAADAPQQRRVPSRAARPSGVLMERPTMKMLVGGKDGGGSKKRKALRVKDGNVKRGKEGGKASRKGEKTKGREKAIGKGKERAPRPPSSDGASPSASDDDDDDGAREKKRKRRRSARTSTSGGGRKGFKPGQVVYVDKASLPQCWPAVLKYDKKKDTVLFSRLPGLKPSPPDKTLATLPSSSLAPHPLEGGALLSPQQKADLGAAVALAADKERLEEWVREVRREVRRRMRESGELEEESEESGESASGEE
ncbi:hypothetical protein JCM10207_009251 [Rhodosporidiobolus poonsookiae]